MFLFFLTIISYTGGCEKQRDRIRRTSEADRIKVTAERDVFKKQSGSKNYWIAGLLLALGGLAFFKIKSLLSPKKAAETINNIV